MGDKDYRTTIKNAIDSIGRELEIEIDPDDFKTINLLEVVRCLRRSYFDRVDSKEIERRGFNDLLSGLLRKLEYGSEPKEFSIDDVRDYFTKFGLNKPKNPKRDFLILANRKGHLIIGTNEDLYSISYDGTNYIEVKLNMLEIT